jgi:hypothetical protein
MSRSSHTLIRWLVIAWASPNSMIGLIFGVLALLSGGGAQVKRGCVEFHGGLVKRILSLMLSGDGAAAMTLGHTILGQTPEMLRLSRDHEHVHVQQYERWGPFFLPAYFGSSFILWIRGRDCYMDNPFEIEAYAIAPLDLLTSESSDGSEVASETGETERASGY